MFREEALNIVRENAGKENLIKHMLAVEAIMSSIAKFLVEDEEKWSSVGLLHDVDYGKTGGNPKEHGMMAEKILEGKVDGEMIRSIKSHNFEHTGVMPENKMDYALIASDAVSGLIIANALVMPTKKLADIKLESLIDKFNQKDFARNCKRENILYCEKIGIERDKFLEISLNSLQNISRELGL
jgi:uncharacterized protein